MFGVKFWRFKLTYYGQWNPQVDEVLHKNYFPDKKDGFFIECGAGNGVYMSCCKFFDDVGWNGITIEPNKQAYDILCKTRPKCINLNVGLSNHIGVSKFETAWSGGDYGGAIKYHPTLKSQVASMGYSFSECEINLTTYDNIVENNNVTHVDLFVVDVEGYELDVIIGMTKVKPSVICIEYPISGLDNIKQALSDYRFDFISFNNAFFSTGIDEKNWFGKTELYQW